MANNGKSARLLWVILLILLAAALWGWLRPTPKTAIVRVDLVDCSAEWVAREPATVALDCAVTVEDEDGDTVTYQERGHDTTEVVGPGDEGRGD